MRRKEHWRGVDELADIRAVDRQDYRPPDCLLLASSEGPIGVSTSPRVGGLLVAAVVLGCSSRTGRPICWSASG